tara:strand:- start:5 stop:592 length:588 start_codon:yes stop_codon:yes gene_type:complete
MRGVYSFLVKPKGKRYNNSKKIGKKELILNTEVFNHQFVNREAIVKATPMIRETEINVGDTVILHHNVFRRWHNQYGEEKNSKSYFNEDNYIVNEDQIFAYKNNNIWKPLKGFCFIQPLKENNPLHSSNEKLIGVVKYSDGTVKEGDLVRFKALGQYEFIIDGQRLYRVKSNLITIKYEYQGHEETYNPSWAQSS